MSASESRALPPRRPPCSSGRFGEASISAHVAAAFTCALREAGRGEGFVVLVCSIYTMYSNARSGNNGLGGKIMMPSVITPQSTFLRTKCQHSSLHDYPAWTKSARVSRFPKRHRRPPMHLRLTMAPTTRPPMRGLKYQTPQTPHLSSQTRNDRLRSTFLKPPSRRPDRAHYYA